MSESRCKYYRNSLYTVTTREHKLLCLLCAVYCHELQEESVKEVIRSANSCDCAHHSPAKIHGQVKDSLAGDDIPLRSLVAANVFLKNFQ